MKKIVGILAAAAVATSVFAADVSAATKIKGTLFSYDADKTITLFSEVNDSHDYANPNITFSISDDKAGATIKLTTDGNKGDSITDIYSEIVAQTTQTIWFKPVDALKITVGNFDVALNKEQIDWTESVTGLGGNGFLVSVNVEGFGLDLGLSQADNGNWFEKADAAEDPTIKAFFVKAGYSADFGNIGAYVEFNRAGAERKVYAWHDDLFQGWLLKKGAIKDLHFGAGYGNNFNGINMFVNVAGFMADKFEWIRPELYAAGSVEDFGYAAFVAPVIFTNSDYDIDPACELTVKLTYKIDSITPYVYFNDKDLLADDFVSTIKIGATGSVGAMGYNVWAQIDTGKGDANDKVAFSVPFELTVSF